MRASGKRRAKSGEWKVEHSSSVSNHMLVSTALGTFTLTGSRKGVSGVTLAEGTESARSSVPSAHASRCAAQLREYLDGRRRKFTLPLDLRGTPFQRTVWRVLAKVPYGATMTYGQLARRIGRPRAVRAVASAVSRNPVAILIPCHRIIPQSGGPGEYAWGKGRKAWLLEHEDALRDHH